MRLAEARLTFGRTDTLGCHGPGRRCLAVTTELMRGAGAGVATFSGGTGKFSGFEARVDISADASGLWHWEGTYSFSPSD